MEVSMIFKAEPTSYRSTLLCITLLNIFTVYANFKFSQEVFKLNLCGESSIAAEDEDLAQGENL